QQVTQAAATDIPLQASGYVREENVNIRQCGRLQNCDILFQLDKGQYCKVLAKTKQKERIKGLGEHPWYFIQVGQKKGYIFGALLVLQSDQIEMDSINVRLYNRPNQNAKVVDILQPDDSYTILAQSERSELIRPYGRHYWYKITGQQIGSGWVYGAFTSKSNAPVDCQCVDYVKNTLSITGPTKNAFEWDQVLNGYIPVRQNQEDTLLNYREIYEFHELKQGDIAIFNKTHPQADRNYGHIGFIHKFVREKGRPYAIIEGGNHQVPIRFFYTEEQCNNVSKKKYRIGQHVRFFRQIETTTAAKAPNK
ncbi:MAG: CHAP domain-containing protein, partial [Bacteroidota bacterium]